MLFPTPRKEVTRMNGPEILVVGGGPSGLRAATLLARSGFGVRVFERKSEIGADVICTGIVGKEIFPEFGLRTESVLREIQDVRLISSTGSEISYRHPVPFACVVDRERFDRALADEARAAGVDITLGASVSRVERTGRGIRIEADGPGGEKLRSDASMAILATGIDCRLNAQAGLGVPNDRLFGAQAELETGGDGAATIFVGKNVAPGAFGWSVPISGGRTRIGLITSLRPRAWLENLICRAHPGLADRLGPEDIRIKAIAQGLVARSAADRVISLGEAAGQVKTTTGGGIYFGLLCARIAARVIAEAAAAGSFAARRLGAYEESWRSAIKKEILVGHFARRVFARFTDNQIERLFDLARTDGIIPLMQSEGRFDWQSGLILDLARKVPPLRAFGGIRKKLSAFDQIPN
jgi:digeranylgeranylglycerophospholipid reductase